MPKSLDQFACDAAMLRPVDVADFEVQNPVSPAILQACKGYLKTMPAFFGDEVGEVEPKLRQHGVVFLAYVPWLLTCTLALTKVSVAHIAAVNVGFLTQLDEEIKNALDFLEKLREQLPVVCCESIETVRCHLTQLKSDRLEKLDDLVKVQISDASQAVDKMVDLSTAEEMAAFVRIPEEVAPTRPQYQKLASWASKKDGAAFWAAFKVAERAMEEYAVLIDLGAERQDELEQKYDQYLARFVLMTFAKAMVDPMSDEIRLKNMEHFAEALDTVGLGKGIVDDAQAEVRRLKDKLGEHA